MKTEGAYFPTKSIALKQVSLGMKDIQKLSGKLEERVAEQADIELQRYDLPSGWSQEEFDEKKEELKRDAYGTMLTIMGRDGSSFTGGPDILSSPNLPKRIDSIYISNIANFQHKIGSTPINRFELRLDFTKPHLIDHDNPISGPTANNSALSVVGDSDNWISSVTSAVTDVLVECKNKRDHLHRGSIYDVGLITVIIPLAFYICWKFAPWINGIWESNQFVSSALFAYLFFLSVWTYRLLFGYARWSFPSVELSDSQDESSKHRSFLYAILVGITASLIYDAFKMLL